MLRKGCRGYLCTIEATELKDLDLNEIPVAREFAQVFQEVLGYHTTEKSNSPLNLYLELPNIQGTVSNGTC